MSKPEMTVPISNEILAKERHKRIVEYIKERHYSVIVSKRMEDTPRYKHAMSVLHSLISHNHADTDELEKSLDVFRNMDGMPFVPPRLVVDLKSLTPLDMKLLGEMYERRVINCENGRLHKPHYSVAKSWSLLYALWQCMAVMPLHSPEYRHYLMPGYYPRS